MSSTYPSSLYKIIATIDEDHFWFTSRGSMIKDFIGSFISHPAGKQLLEVGCGTGIVMAQLEHMGFTCTGLDVNAQAIAYAKRRTKGRLVLQSIFRYTPTSSFDVVGAFDVLEHIGDERKFLSICHALLSSKGHLILTVPAGRWLWNETDRASGHMRRYERDELRDKLVRAGFTVQSMRYWNVLLFPLYALWHWISGMNRKDSVTAHLHRIPKWANTLLEWVFSVELFLFSRMQPPFGATLVVWAQKEDKV